MKLQMRPLILAVLLCACVAHAQTGGTATAGRIPVPDPRPLMVMAIDSPSGEAHGVLTGGMADAITRRFKSTSPIHIDVATERRYKQPGCSRLKVTFTQDGVRLPGSPAPKKQIIDFGINYCRDGLPPRPLS